MACFGRVLRLTPCSFHPIQRRNFRLSCCSAPSYLEGQNIGSRATKLSGQGLTDFPIPTSFFFTQFIFLGCFQTFCFVWSFTYALSSKQPGFSLKNLLRAFSKLVISSPQLVVLSCRLFNSSSRRVKSLLLRNVVVLGRTRPRSMPLAMLTMKKELHTFLFLCFCSNRQGAPDV